MRVSVLFSERRNSRKSAFIWKERQKTSSIHGGVFAVGAIVAIASLAGTAVANAQAANLASIPGAVGAVAAALKAGNVKAAIKVACPADVPDCAAAKKALSDALMRQSQQTEQNPALAPALRSQAPNFGGLTNKAKAPANPGAAAPHEGDIHFGMIAPFSGANKGSGSELKVGVETAFDVANDAGGVNGRMVRLDTADDGYDPSRTPDLAKSMLEKYKVLGFVCNFGTPTSASILPYVLEHKLLFFGALTGADVLRRDPPDRYVFNYRPSYAEETDAAVRYLVKVRRLRADEIAVFAQQDGFGNSGYSGVERAVRSLNETTAAPTLRLNYARNTVDVASAVASLKKHRKEIKAVVMVATYRAAAKFIEKTREVFPDLIYTNVSAVGSTALAEELMLLGPRFAEGIVVTQIVPPPDGYSTLALEYKAALAKYSSSESPDYVSLEGYVDAKILLEELKRAGPNLDSDKLVDAFEKTHDLDLGLGVMVNFGRNDHQAMHKVWGTMLDAKGHYQSIDLK